MSVVSISRRKKFPEPIPPLKRKPVSDQPQEFARGLQVTLMALAVMKATGNR